MGVEESLNQLTLAIQQRNEKLGELVGAIAARNKLEDKQMELDERRELREFRFRWFLAIGVLILAGVKVGELTGLLP